MSDNEKTKISGYIEFQNGSKLEFTHVYEGDAKGIDAITISCDLSAKEGDVTAVTEWRKGEDGNMKIQSVQLTKPTFPKDRIG